MQVSNAVDATWWYRYVICKTITMDGSEFLEGVLQSITEYTKRQSSLQAELKARKQSVAEFIHCVLHDSEINALSSMECCLLKFHPDMVMLLIKYSEDNPEKWNFDGIRKVLENQPSENFQKYFTNIVGHSSVITMLEDLDKYAVQSPSKMQVIDRLKSVIIATCMPKLIASNCNVVEAIIAKVAMRDMYDTDMLLHWADENACSICLRLFLRVFPYEEHLVSIPTLLFYLVPCYNVHIAGDFDVLHVLTYMNIDLSPCIYFMLDRISSAPTCGWHFRFLKCFELIIRATQIETSQDSQDYMELLYKAFARSELLELVGLLFRAGYCPIEEVLLVNIVNESVLKKESQPLFNKLLRYHIWCTTEVDCSTDYSLVDCLSVMYKQPRTLQNISAIAVRQMTRWNVFYNVKHICIPEATREIIRFDM